MKVIQGVSGGDFRHGWLNKCAGYVVGGLLFVSATASIATAETAMTQQQFLQSMASICGDSLPPSASGADLVAWARSKGISPTAGWNLNTRLTKEVVAQTLMQLLRLKPGSVNSDAVSVLEREGIVIPTNDGYVTAQTFRRVISDQLVQRAATGRGNGDDDGNSPTPTRPGNGYGDKNHDHTGPPGKNK